MMDPHAENAWHNQEKTSRSDVKRRGSKQIKREREQ